MNSLHHHQVPLLLTVDKYIFMSRSAPLVLEVDYDIDIAILVVD